MSLTPDAAVKAARAKLATGVRIDKTTTALAGAWSRAWDEISAEWTSAIDDLIAAAADGQWPTRAQIIRSTRAQAALQAAGDALGGLAAETQARIIGDLPGLVALASEQQQRLTVTQLPKDSIVNWARMDEKALQSIVSRTTQQVTALTWPLAADATGAMKSALIRGVAVGDNPRTAARDMLRRVRGEFNGGYRRAENIARTEMIDAHREASRLAQDANRDVLKGWRWTAALSERTCGACLSMHGRVFDLDEPGPMGHQSCRCARSPVAKSWRELGFNVDEPPRNAPTGPEWLARQPADVQRKVLGPARYNAWKAGRYPPEQWAVRRTNAGWRDSFQVGKAPAGLTGATGSAATQRINAAIAGRGKVVGFDAAGLDARAVDETLDTLAELLERYPGVKIDVILDEDAFTGSMRTATAYHMGRKDGTHQLYFRATTHVDYEATVKASASAVRTGWLVDNQGTPFRAVAAHEFGHAVEFEFARELAPNWPDGAHRTGASFLQHCLDDGAKTMTQAKGRLKRQSPSDYGATNFAEVFAETFCELYLNGGTPSSRKFSKWMAEKLIALGVTL